MTPMQPERALRGLWTQLYADPGFVAAWRELLAQAAAGDLTDPAWPTPKER